MTGTPETTTISFFSGGLGSFAATLRFQRQHPGDELILLFADTRIEDPDLYRFITQAAAHLQLPLHITSDGRTPWEVFYDVRYIGNNRIAPCSRILKTEQCEKWLKERYPDPGKAALMLGIDWSESHRLERAQRRWEPYKVIAPLTDPPYLTPDDVLLESLDAGIEPPSLYDEGFPHNNCGGFCCRSGQGQMKMLFQQHPDRYRMHENEEQRVMRNVPTARPFLRKTCNGNLTYITLKEFRERHLEPSCDIDESEIGGCGCFVDDD